MRYIRYRVEIEGEVVHRSTIIDLTKAPNPDDLISFIEKKITKRFRQTDKNLVFYFDHVGRKVTIGSGIRKKKFLIDGKIIELYVGGRA